MVLGITTTSDDDGDDSKGMDMGMDKDNNMMNRVPWPKDRY